MDNFWKRTSVALGAMFFGSLLTVVVLTLPESLQRDIHAQDQPGAPIQGQHLDTAQDLSLSFRNVAESLRPSVVSISTKQTQMIRGRQSQRRALPPGFEDFFGYRPQAPQQRESEGMGSGVIVRKDGYVLTNNHVVEGADEIKVQLSDGRIVQGEMVGTDPQTDLAVIKIDLDGLQPVLLGSSDDIRVGDWVLAIGSPFGLDQTVTAGIISGKNRVQGIVDDGNGFEDFLQTDAAINPGNSGGPLVNLQGELVGINTAILSRSGASAGIGFAIPVSLAKPVLESIIESGQVRRGFLGAQVVDVTPESVRKFNLSVNSGALIGGLLENQPAAKAGLQPGDVVTTLDGRPVRSGTQLRNYIASRPPGAAVEMGIIRNGEKSQVTVQLQERTDAAMAMFGAGSIFGADLVPVTPETAREYGYEELRSGLIVTSVEDGSVAAQGELQVGDVIESAANIQVSSVDQLSMILAESQKQQQPLRLVVRRGNSRMLLVVR
ncbi:Periplasmic pH-dependent serine endoprotease DegQ precursor [Novipirellula galeiformis]|uniref:Periplasmic pH-dependent serine endoprotease DegQ n=1 Tax=Novipirellula galeiformis TaxID=2528004 RepID=A0A5C6CGR0_9BACT|nr:Do family serine endopeptidase [Novipirellula galeiformis]TWU22426.1 Periplasmic pH-dependent serine endoprotease DegQ precursor [Novipirellula galeiformis]